MTLKEALWKALKQSGMRQTKCAGCGLVYLTRRAWDRCPECSPPDPQAVVLVCDDGEKR